MLKQLLRIERVHELIKRRATGSPKELANRLEVSQRQLYNIIELMKDLGAPIVYSFSRCSYIYEHEVEWQFGFKAKTLSSDKMSRLQGSGCLSNKYTSLQYYFIDKSYSYA